MRSPIDGIAYLRPSPGAPAFVEIGGEVTEGQTVALVEVMKTFHPLRYGGPGLPPRARVVSIEVHDGAEVRQGQVLARVEGV
ncbi:hypothetical protein L6R50_05585 [Myxococcota bacterium]|nr:hypothetical protein [Myxococcota bacterium]